MTRTRRLAAATLAAACASLLTSPAPAWAGCDLKAVFVEPERTHQGPDVPVAVRLSSVGSGDCKGNAVTLLAHAGSRASGYARAVGRARPLPALSPGQSETLRYEDVDCSPGTYTYSIRFATSHSDDDNANHRPTHTVEVR